MSKGPMDREWDSNDGELFLSSPERGTKVPQVRDPRISGGGARKEG